MSEQLRVVSFGGGVQSTALLVLAAQGKIDYRTFLFANVGDDSENPATLRYVKDIAKPFAAQHDLAIIEVRRTRRNGTPYPTILETVVGPTRTLVIPSRTPNGFMRRNCTQDWKITVLARWQREHGASEEQPASVALGISVDELHRARSNSRDKAQRLDYPLLTLRMDRSDCRSVILEAGLPIPEKSSCWFCPFHSNTDWQRMRDDDPATFAKAVALEETLNEKAVRLGRRAGLHFHNKRVPLPMATSPIRQPGLFDDAPVLACESGYCMT